MPIPRKLKPDQDAKQRIRDWAKSAGMEPWLEEEYYFARSKIGRNWRFDFAWPDTKVAVEFEGGVHIQGRHSRGAGFVKDAEKYNTALVMGWRVLRVTTDLVLRKDRIVFKWLEELFRANPQS